MLIERVTLTEKESQILRIALQDKYDKLRRSPRLTKLIYSDLAHLNSMAAKLLGRTWNHRTIE